MGAVSYMYSDRTTEEYGFEDSYELYAIASFDVLLAPTFSYYQDMDAVEGGFATFGVSHSYPLGEKASLDFSAALSFDFGYNLGESVAADYGLEESNGDLNDVLIGLDVPVQITDWFGFHVMAQQSIALDVLDDLGRDRPRLRRAGDPPDRVDPARAGGEGAARRGRLHRPLELPAAAARLEAGAGAGGRQHRGLQALGADPASRP